MFRQDIDDWIGNSTQPEFPELVQFGDRDIGWQALGPALACTILSTVVVGIRWYTRSRIVRCVGGDDVVILLSLLLAWVMTAIIAAEVHEGIGNYNGPDHLADLTELVVANNSVWALCITVTKLSILMQYLRIFSGPNMRLLCYALITFLVPTTCWAVLGGTLLCQPVAKLWNPQLPGSCMSAQAYWISVAGIDIALDFLVLMLPMPAIAALRLPRKEKTVLLGAFLLGFVVCIVSVIRLATVVATAQQGDYVISDIWSIIWSIVEANVGIICASLLALKPLLIHLWPVALEELAVPKHCMRLPRVENNTSRSNEATMVYKGSSSASKSDGTLHRASPPCVNPGLAVPRHSLTPDGIYALAETLDVLTPARCVEDGTLSFTEMLRSGQRHVI